MAVGLFTMPTDSQAGQEGPPSAVSAISPFGPFRDHSFDFCAKSAIQDEVDDYLANPDPSKLKPLKLPVPPDAISVERAPAQLKVFDETDPGKCYFRVFLVPVGYPPDQIDNKMNELIHSARIAFSGVLGLSFAYVSQSYNVNFGHIERLIMPATIKFPEKLWESLAKPNAVVFVLNTEEWVGTAEFDDTPPWAVITGEDNYSNIMLAHELGHVLSLGDGYPRFYRACEIPGTELFFEDLPSNVYEAYSAATIFPRIIRAGKCDTQEVFRFADSENTAMTHISNLGCSYGDKAHFYAFNEIQTRIMDSFVRRHLAAKCGQ